MDKTEQNMRTIAVRLRKIRELKGLTREKFCEVMNENIDYWGKIERCEQLISLPKLIQVCEAHLIPIESVLELDYRQSQNTLLKNEILEMMELCGDRQLEVIKKFIQEIALTL